MKQSNYNKNKNSKECRDHIIAKIDHECHEFDQHAFPKVYDHQQHPLLSCALDSIAKTKAMIYTGVVEWDGKGYWNTKCLKTPFFHFFRFFCTEEECFQFFFFLFIYLFFFLSTFFCFAFSFSFQKNAKELLKVKTRKLVIPKGGGRKIQIKIVVHFILCEVISRFNISFIFIKESFVH